jgi:hypothetical protein
VRAAGADRGDREVADVVLLREPVGFEISVDGGGYGGSSVLLKRSEGMLLLGPVNKPPMELFLALGLSSA